MSLLGAAALNFAGQLRKHSKGWSISPLVVEEERLTQSRNKGGLFHNSLLSIKRPAVGQSPIDFYIANPPLLARTFLQVKQHKRPLRVIGLELVSTDKYVVNLTFWRANGYAHRERSTSKNISKHYTIYQRYKDQGYDALLMCEIYHVAAKTSKGHRVRYRHSYDLTLPEAPTPLVDTVIQVINKSYEWWGRGKKEIFDPYGNALMVDLTGKNYNVDEFRRP